jgi:ribosome-associated protein
MFKSGRVCGLRSKKALTPTIHSGAERIPLQPALGPQPDTGKLVRNVLHSLEDAKAEDIVSINLQGKTTLADLMFVVSGRSNVHVGAIAERVIKACKEMGVAAPRVEGLPQCDWVLVDAGDVIVHIFRPEVRQFYNLEKMWGGDRPAEKGARAGDRLAV